MLPRSQQRQLVVQPPVQAQAQAPPWLLPASEQPPLQLQQAAELWGPAGHGPAPAAPLLISHAAAAARPSRINSTAVAAPAPPSSYGGAWQLGQPEAFQGHLQGYTPSPSPPLLECFSTAWQLRPDGAPEAQQPTCTLASRLGSLQEPAQAHRRFELPEGSFSHLPTSPLACTPVPSWLQPPALSPEPPAGSAHSNSTLPRTIPQPPAAQHHHAAVEAHAPHTAVGWVPIRADGSLGSVAAPEPAISRDVVGPAPITPPQGLGQQQGARQAALPTPHLVHQGAGLHKVRISETVRLGLWGWTAGRRGGGAQHHAMLLHPARLLVGFG